MTEIPNEYGPATPPPALPPKAARRRRPWLRLVGWGLVLAPVGFLAYDPVMGILAIPALLPFCLAGSFILFLVEPKEGGR